MDEPTDVPDEGSGYEILVPFVVTSSKGGPYDDVSYAAGFEAGRVAGSLEATGRYATYTATVRSDNVRQVDLFAMHYGFVLRTEQSPDPAWSFVTLTRATDAKFER